MFKLNMMEYALDVQVERRQGNHSPLAKTRRKKSFISFILTYVVQCLCIHLGSHLYYITFIDDFSRKTWIYYLKHKDEAFEIFKEFKALVENHTRKKIKIFRSDDGREHISN